MKINDLYEGKVELSNKQLQIIKSSEWFQKGIVFYRGVNLSVPSIKQYNIDKSRERTPLDISNDVHTNINKLSKRKFGYPVRNGIFLYPKLSTKTSTYYGKIMVVIPIGDNALFYAKGIEDLYGDLNELPSSNAMYSEYISRLNELTFDTDISDNVEVMGFGKFIMIDYDLAQTYGLVGKDEAYVSWDEFKGTNSIDILKVKFYIKTYGQITNSLIDDILYIIKTEINGPYTISTTLADLKLYTNKRILSAVLRNYEVLYSMLALGRFVQYILSDDSLIDRLNKTLCKFAIKDNNIVDTLRLLTTRQLINNEKYIIKMLEYSKTNNYKLYERYYNRMLQLKRVPESHIDTNIEVY